MLDIMEAVRQAAAARGRSLEGIPFPEVIRLEPGAVKETAGYLAETGRRSIVVVSDAVIGKAVRYELMKDLIANGSRASLIEVLPNAVGDVVADEASIVQVLLEIQKLRADAVVALGAGTIHDIVRYAAFSSGLPFVSVPTAPSVDGFTSRGAPILIRGHKLTVPAIGPSAIFADTHILKEAPAAMVAAGFGDMLGKYTSLFDWTFEHMVTGAPYDELSADLTMQALASCIDQVEAIGSRTQEGVSVLMQALIQSGLAMLIFGQSHPASGAEHHLSHYWEMEFLRTGRRQLLHGAKVGAACAVIARLYRELADSGLPYGSEGALPEELRHAARQAEGRWPEIRQLIGALPEPERIQAWLTAAQGPATTEELGIGPEFVARALREADEVRPSRLTLLRLYNSLLRHQPLSS
ncbi:sn-glycerol-1-phosphate dehydrogenase [Paenibacillus sp. CC-CFT747]|nr:sn-glycerol-1-phosphate dehydrogenase [Paenibacillus sp. CC-CFT747]